MSRRHVHAASSKCKVGAMEHLGQIDPLPRLGVATLSGDSLLGGVSTLRASVWAKIIASLG